VYARLHVCFLGLDSLFVFLLIVCVKLLLNISASNIETAELLTAHIYQYNVKNVFNE